MNAHVLLHNTDNKTRSPRQLVLFCCGYHSKKDTRAWRKVKKRKIVTRSCLFVSPEGKYFVIMYFIHSMGNI